jgi:hypothetical protein
LPIIELPKKEKELFNRRPTGKGIFERMLVLVFKIFYLFILILKQYFLFLIFYF